MANSENGDNADKDYRFYDKPEPQASAIIRPYMIDELSPFRCRIIRGELQRQYGKSTGAACRQIRNEISKRLFDEPEVKKLFTIFMQNDGSQLDEWRTLRKRYDKNPSKYIKKQQ